MTRVTFWQKKELYNIEGNFSGDAYVDFILS